MLRRRLKGYSNDQDSASVYLEQRQVLSKNIAALHILQRVYIPGSKPLLDNINPVTLADHPEDIKLWLPSALPPGSRNAQCVGNLPQLEFRLRSVQAANALHDVRTCCRLRRALGMKTQLHLVNTQKTRNRTLYDSVNINLSRAVSTYQAAWTAIGALAPNEEFGVWKETLQKLESIDVRGPGQEDHESSSRFVKSWIWNAPRLPTSTSIEDPDLRTALRIEWCKVQERAKRYEEELELVVEEMRRTLATFEWNAQEWETFAISPPLGDSAIDATTIGGVAAYAYKQADVQRKMVKTFADDWYHLLEQQSPKLSWLEGYPRPPDIKRCCLVSNVQLYHPGVHTDLPNTDEISSD